MFMEWAIRLYDVKMSEHDIPIRYLYLKGVYDELSTSYFIITINFRSITSQSKISSLLNVVSCDTCWLINETDKKKLYLHAFHQRRKST